MINKFVCKIVKRYLSAGDIRRSGGKFGQKEAALENQFFKKRVYYCSDGTSLILGTRRTKRD